MGLFDKVKNLFTEEVEVEETEPKKEEIQKEVIKVEIPSGAEKQENDGYEVEGKEEQKKEEYKFPFFDDDDFDTIDIEKPVKKEKRKSYHEVYNPPKEEKKVFKPSPIISPVYGFLDKNYQKEELVQKNNEYNPHRASVDEIRDRAYGSLESDIETTLFGSNRVLFDDKKSDNDKIEKIEEEKAIDEAINNYDSKTIDEKPRHESQKEDNDLTDLLEAEMAKQEKEEKKNKKPRKISDKELFSLIDSMYEGEIK